MGQIGVKVRVGVAHNLLDAAGVMPVLRLGIVKAQPQAMTVAGAAQLPGDVAAKGGSVHHVVGAGAGVIHGEAIVVLGGEHHVAHPCPGGK